MSSSARQRNLGGGGQHVLDYLKRMQAENPSFFYAVQGDNEHSSGNIFWADSASRMNYNYFGDTVRLDTSYRANHYRVPFATLSGLNHHGQPVLFGCALLLNESGTAFVWLLQTWLQAMSGSFPVSITTDPDRLIQMAVAQVLPETRHRFCKWSIFRETQEKLAHIYQTYPTLEIDFKKCIHDTETIDEFESRWKSLLEKYSLMDNEWLQSMYNARHQWVPVYTRETFFGEFYTTNSSEAISTFFDGYVNAATTIQSLIKQYEKAVTSWHEKELKADFDTTNTMPVLKTPSPMEKQAANLYTRRAFIKFQEELVETLANPATKVEDSGTITLYRVAKFGEEHKAHTRWTRDAKSGGLVDERAPELPTDSRESLTVRYNNLRQDAIKFVEEGAKSIHIYHVAMDALQEAAKKVAASKKQRSGASQGAVLSNGGNQEMHVGEKDLGTPFQSSEEKEKKIRELTTELDSINQRCDVYRANLLAVLRDMEDQKLKLSVKVQNARLSLKE